MHHDDRAERDEPEPEHPPSDVHEDLVERGRLGDAQLGDSDDDGGGGRIEKRPRGDSVVAADTTVSKTSV